MLRLLSLLDGMYLYVSDIFSTICTYVSSVSSVITISSVTCEPVSDGVCIDMYYTYKYILYLIFSFFEGKLLLFLLLFLLLYQTMIKYNNVINIRRRGKTQCQIKN